MRDEQKQNAPEVAAADSEIRELRHTLLTHVMRVLFLAGFPALIVGGYYVATDGNWMYGLAYVVLFCALGILYVARRIPYHVRIGALLALAYGLALLSVFRGGLSSNVRLFLLMLPLMAVVFLGRRAGFVALALSMLTMSEFAGLFSLEILKIPVSVQVLSHKPMAWFSYTLTLLFVSAFVITSLNQLVSRFREVLIKSHDLANKLDTQRMQAEQNAEYAYLHAVRMQWVAEFGNALASLRRREMVAWRTVRDMERSLDLYQVNVFLTDRTGSTLILAAAAGAQGEALVAEGFSVWVGERSLLGQVAQTGREQVRVLSPDEAEEFPLSRVEMALPLVVRGELLGVLDIHSTEATFSDSDMQLFRVVAGYVTASLDMLAALEEINGQLQEMRTLYSQYTTAGWRSLLEAKLKLSYTAGALPEAAVQTLAAEALRDRAIRSCPPVEGTDDYLLVVPLIARDVPLGYLAFTRSVEQGDWDAETRVFIEAAAERLALALDNTRLLVQTRRQAFYQEQLGRLDDVVWRNPSTAAIMESSVQELGRVLDAHEVQIYLTPVQWEAQ
ncbi:MAG TPA: GAF domain-containing protein [Anaerolineae bacterium]|nr:GAF domain-containing protein [Anaerolineae bacterium]